MLRFVVFVVVLVAVCGVFIPGDTQSVKIFDNADRYDTELDDTLQNISYTFGKRVDGKKLNGACSEQKHQSYLIFLRRSFGSID